MSFLLLLTDQYTQLTFCHCFVNRPVYAVDFSGLCHSGTARMLTMSVTKMWPCFFVNRPVYAMDFPGLCHSRTTRMMTMSVTKMWPCFFVNRPVCAMDFSGLCHSRTMRMMTMSVTKMRPCSSSLPTSTSSWVSPSAKEHPSAKASSRTVSHLPLLIQFSWGLLYVRGNHRLIRDGPVQFSSRWYLCALKSPCVLHAISQG